ncbi:hypothetical protein GCWU000342_00949 [Shuttleworthella satelles DSM 14600]|uniref:Uncharacterized protein n=1 Tax=Shuttleworthella satelles DSM 14600 TaxID=626523 RepID=C4GAJ8_9FIRM|nr:hypothetical protein GCWU000342_00949 [Shuttleworthia satelles DSM 14600]
MYPFYSLLVRVILAAFFIRIIAAAFLARVIFAFLLIPTIEGSLTAHRLLQI